MQEQIIKKLDAMEARLGSIETAMAAIAVQDNKIINLQQQINSLWKKQDSLTAPDGTIAQIRQYQASCPRVQMPRMWWAIGLIATLCVSIITVAVSLK